MDAAGSVEVISLDEFEDLEKLKYEKELLGFYVTGHPLGSYKDAVERLSCKTYKEMEDAEQW